MGNELVGGVAVLAVMMKGVSSISRRVVVGAGRVVTSVEVLAQAKRIRLAGIRMTAIK